MGSETARFNQEMRHAQKSDQMEIRDLLARLVNDVEDVRKLVTLESDTRPVVDEVMQSLQTVRGSFPHFLDYWFPNMLSLPGTKGS
jgi:hypothetical protein